MFRNHLELVQKIAACQHQCNHCFKSCLEEDQVKMMVDCIKLDRECSDICALTLQMVASESYFAKDMVLLCINACQKCAQECEKHDNDHCRECAAACRECEEACRKLYMCE